jgi:hypothetical protein
MTYKEVTERLSQEGITVEIFCDKLFKPNPYREEKSIEWRNAELQVPWLGPVNLVKNKTDEYPETKDSYRFAMLDRVYHLPTHDVYLQVVASEEEAPEWETEDGEENPEREAWEEKCPGQEWRWVYNNPRFSPVKAVTVCRVEYHYAPELLELPTENV